MCSRIDLKMARIQLHFQSSSMQAPYLFLRRWWCLCGRCTKDVGPTKQFSIKTFPEHKCVTRFPPAANRGEVWWPGGDAPSFFYICSRDRRAPLLQGPLAIWRNNIHRTSSARVMLTNISSCCFFTAYVRACAFVLFWLFLLMKEDSISPSAWAIRTSIWEVEASMEAIAREAIRKKVWKKGAQRKQTVHNCLSETKLEPKWQASFWHLYRQHIACST